MNKIALSHMTVYSVELSGRLYRGLILCNPHF